MIKTENERPRRHGWPHPGRHDHRDHRPDHREVRRGGRHGLPRPQVPQLDNFWANFDNALNLVIQKDEDPTKAAPTPAPR